ncbi:hypothetical protein KUTeg_021256 [Tegillarca granosa]|uniref:TLC domain-containing protein n=1 Tax=Tegillarca granosa TaxID=220873 RepID=A0ABQ9EA93_TEGGR|nr:hypothetical protein KUTeg_021256 [Tegillarca granosa]
MGLVEYIHPALATADYRKTSVKLFFIFASFLFFAAVYSICAAFSAATRTYNNLRRKEKLFWNLAIVRAIYGIFCTVVGIWAIFIDTELNKDAVYATTPTSYFALTVTVGFFVFECSMILVTDIVYKQVSILLNIHHWLSLIGYSTLMIVESSHFFGTKGLILEMSTPFSAICWTVLKAGKAHSLFWKANQFLLVHTFHLRSVVEFYLWYETYMHWDRIWDAMPAVLFTFLYVQLTLVTFVMTPYWTYKKTQQMITPVDWNFEDSENNKASNGVVKKDV